MDNHHSEISHTNLINHAKKKAKKLFKLAQNQQNSLVIENLSQAQDIIAKINGYENWHILEKLEKTKVFEKDNLKITTNFPVINKSQSHLLIEEIDINHEPENTCWQQDNYLYSVIEFKDISFSSYGEILKLLKSDNPLISDLKLLLDREFSSISVNFFYNNYFDSSDVLSSHDNKNLIEIDENLRELFKIPELAQGAQEKNKYAITCVVTIKTFIVATQEHHQLITLLEQALSLFSHTKIISGPRLFEIKDIINNQNNKLTQNVFSVKKKISNEENPFKFIIVALKYLQLFQSQNFNWRLNVALTEDEINVGVDVFADSLEELKKMNYFIDGYQKEISKNDIGYLEKSLNTNEVKLPYLIKKNKMFNPLLSQSSFSLIPKTTLIGSKPGSGKSMLINLLNMSQYLINKKVPHIKVIDIGPSSKPLVDFLKHVVPAAEKSKIGYFKIKMTPEYAVNIFDTHLGCRFPTTEQKEFLHNFLLLLLTDPNTGILDAGMSGVVRASIETVYEHHSDKNLPNLYNIGVNKEIDNILEKNGVKTDKNTTWWELVDILFIKNLINEAKIAQRYAVPLLSDIIYSIQDNKIYSIYSMITLGNGENIIEYVTRIIAEVMNEYPLLSRPTVFDIDNMKTVVLDLDEVAKSGGPMALRQTAIMYMFARNVLGKDLKWGPDTVNEMPYPNYIPLPNFIPAAQYKSYHQKKIKEAQNNYQCLCFDEFHRTSKSSVVQEQIILDMRESRKWNINIILGSQLLTELNETMLSFVTDIFIMDGGPEVYLNELISFFGLNKYSELAKLKKIKNIAYPRPGRIYYKNISNNESELLNIAISKKLQWAMATTIEDAIIKEKLVEKIGFYKALDLLVTTYPIGVKKEIQERSEAMLAIGHVPDNDIIYSQIVEEVIESNVRKK